MSQRTHQIFRLLAIVAATVAGVLYLFADAQPAPSERQVDSAKRVRVAEVERASDSRQLRFSGITRSARRARLGFAVGGRLIERTVEAGDAVREGQVLARVDDREVRNAVATARGALAEVAARRAQAERDVQRVAELVAAKAATSEELEKTRSGLDAVAAAEEAARARVEETERLLEETTLEAPYAGTVMATLLEPGEHAVPGQPVVSLSGRGDLELEVEVPESVVLRLKEGADVDIVVPFLGRTFAGTLHSVGRSSAGAGRLFPVIARISDDDGDLVPGVTAELSVTLASDDALSVPVAAVINPGGRSPAVFRVDDGKAHKVRVEVGSLLGERVTIHAAEGALAEGDQVVVGGQRGLLDGEPVLIQEPKKIQDSTEGEGR